MIWGKSREKRSERPNTNRLGGPGDKESNAKKEGENHNLMILGVIAVAIALVTTVVSIYIYHASGDIYLDRSRPGFLPDEKEVEEELKEDYAFSENSELNNDTLEEYLQNYKEVLEDLDRAGDPFSGKALSDESLGIPGGAEENTDFSE